jgi:hypothetical protein
MSENVKIKDENNDHKFFSILQNVLSRIGLTAYERSVYWAVKECCGEHGSCTKSYANLAKMSGLSVDSLRKALDKLSQENPILKKPLIRIIHRVTECGDRDTNEIKILDIWTDNIRVCQQRGGSSQLPPTSQQQPGGSSQPSGVVAGSKEGGSPQRYKQEPFIKNPMNKTTTSDVVGFFECLLKDTRLTEEEKEALMKSKATQERVLLALEYSKKVKPTTTLIQMLMWHCTEKKPPQIPKEKKKGFKQHVIDYFKNDKIYNGAACFIDSKAINLQRGNPNISYFADPAFENNFREICKRLEIKIGE